jgi:hypothetical protein
MTIALPLAKSQLITKLCGAGEPVETLTLIRELRIPTLQTPHSTIDPNEVEAYKSLSAAITCKVFIAVCECIS